jgi:hypothetical protein
MYSEPSAGIRTTTYRVISELRHPPPGMICVLTLDWKCLITEISRWARLCDAPTSPPRRARLQLRRSEWLAYECDFLIEKNFLSLENSVGKYFLGWLLGVPTVVLIAIYVVFHH